MKKVFDAVKDNPLFSKIEYSEFTHMLRCIDAQVRQYERDEIILLSGNRVNFVGIILSGRVRIIREDVDGNTLILTELSACEVFGEVFACAGIDHSPVTVQATEKSELLLINYKKIITVCSCACAFHCTLISNMLRLIARKNLMLNQKIEILSRRTTREKLLLFFDVHRGSLKKFTIPYNREELARYLCVDRSAMSSELGKMQNEGIIRFKRNEFEIL